MGFCSVPWSGVALSLLWQFHFTSGGITTYGLVPAAQTALAGGPLPTLPAYDQTVLQPPAPPEQPVKALTFEVQRDAADAQGMSIPHEHGAAFYGFSIEMSVIGQTIGKNSTHIFPAFLNLMSNICERAGIVLIRLGGNTQEYARFHGGVFEDGRITQKEKSGTTQTTDTPAVMYTIDLFYMLANVSAMVPVKWFLGLPFNDTSTFHLEMAEYGQAILGDNLIALQAGNEPDLYAAHEKRLPPYLPENFVDEWHELMKTVDENPKVTVKNKFVGPSISGSDPIQWSPDAVWETGFIDTFKDRLYALTVERYLTHNCGAAFGSGEIVNPQDVFSWYLSHQTILNLIGEYHSSTALAQQAGLPFIMFETNTASCGGFAGISQSYGAALWILDYGMYMAYSNFSNALLHIGGQNVFYNPWVAPPTKQSTFHEWTVGSVFYSALIMAEVFGKSNAGRVLQLESGSVFTPTYAIYDGTTLSKFALFNYVNDPTGASDIVVSLSVAGGGVPQSVKVKYLLADSVQSKTNITWAGQTFGNNFEADGLLKGDHNATTVHCDVSANVCRIPLRAPSFALVFMDSTSPEVGQATATYSTTAYTKQHNTLKVDPTSLAVSNGHSGKDRVKMGSTSPGSVVAPNGASTPYYATGGGVSLLLSLSVIIWVLVG
ncbi:glycoside hydrolase family 79 protein [Coprinellus micaceus]|uniref:Glycoside hydrolase family 79 protein n=1 Tax=Coprinellus micaceus TaxID=71717 RepID=A0A4Y7T527_COPMI|nr:glycoside hydrolase family 79 protein [Coprinellus micaceus]